MLPISFFHFQKLKKQYADNNLVDDDDDLEDVL
jgi:CDP-diacylglycerol--serine O-phosphatidyltransferase